MVKLQHLRTAQRAIVLGLLGVTPTLTGTTSAGQVQGLLQPGGQVSVAKIQITAPLHWRAVKSVKVRVRRVSLRDLPVPLMNGLKLVTPVYAISTSETVLTADAGRFVVRLPTGAHDARLVPLRLADVVVDAEPGADLPPELRFWTSDPAARVKNGFVEFDVSGLFADRELFFTVALIN